MTANKTTFFVKNLIQATTSRNEGMKLTKFHNNNAEIVEYLLLAKFEPKWKFSYVNFK